VSLYLVTSCLCVIHTLHIHSISCIWATCCSCICVPCAVQVCELCIRPWAHVVLAMCRIGLWTCTICSCACTVCTAGACRMCWLPADHAVQPGRNTSCIQAAHYAKCPHCVHNTLCPDAGCATVHGQDVFCPQTERTLHIVLSDVTPILDTSSLSLKATEGTMTPCCDT
jgi:hypothetical protein